MLKPVVATLIPRALVLAPSSARSAIFVETKAEPEQTEQTEILRSTSVNSVRFCFRRNLSLVTSAATESGVFFQRAASPAEQPVSELTSFYDGAKVCGVRNRFEWRLDKESSPQGIADEPVASQRRFAALACLFYTNRCSYSHT